MISSFEGQAQENVKNDKKEWGGLFGTENRSLVGLNVITKYSSVHGPEKIHIVLSTFMDQVVTMSFSLYLNYNFIFIIKWIHINVVLTKTKLSH